MTRKKGLLQIKKILCPTDFSDESAAAIRYSAELAKAYNAMVYVCHHKSPSWWKAEHSPSTNIENLNHKIELLINEHGDGESFKWETVVIEGSLNTARCVAAFAAEMSCDLIVLSARHNALTAPLFGLTLERLIRASPCPVLILPADFQESKVQSNAGLNPQRILLNYDFSPKAGIILDYALSLAGKFNAELHLLYVPPVPEKVGIELSQTPAGRKIDEIQVLGKLAAVAGKYADYRIITALRPGNPQKEMIDYAARHKIDLICTTAPDEKFYLEYLFPIWLRQTLENASIPVLVSPDSAEQFSKAFGAETESYAFSGN